MKTVLFLGFTVFLVGCAHEETAYREVNDSVMRQCSGRPAMTPTMFSDLVDDSVVHQAAVTMSRHLGQLTVEDMSKTLRRSSYDKARLYALGCGNSDDDGTAFESGRKNALEIVRAHLINPDRLRTTYMRYKEPVLSGLRFASAAAGNKRVVQEAYEFLLRPVDSETVALNAEVGRLFEQFLRAPEDRRHAISLRYGAAADKLEARVGKQNVYVFQWMQRRFAEGGDALVGAWMEILKDLSESL